jgi:hypothetical protein
MAGYWFSCREHPQKMIAAWMPCRIPKTWARSLLEATCYHKSLLSYAAWTNPDMGPIKAHQLRHFSHRAVETDLTALLMVDDLRSNEMVWIEKECLGFMHYRPITSRSLRIGTIRSSGENGDRNRRICGRGVTLYKPTSCYARYSHYPYVCPCI